jgi:hypothetical protein
MTLALINACLFDPANGYEIDGIALVPNIVIVGPVVATE